MTTETGETSPNQNLNNDNISTNTENLGKNTDEEIYLEERKRKIIQVIGKR